MDVVLYCLEYRIRLIIIDFSIPKVEYSRRDLNTFETIIKSEKMTFYLLMLYDTEHNV